MVVYQQRFLELRAKHPNFNVFYTDGSKTVESVGCAFVLDSQSSSYSLHPACSMYTAELYAILKALDFADVNGLKKVLVGSDSTSELQTLDSPYSRHPVAQRIFKRLVPLSARADVHFCWVPSHVGIQGNEAADAAAKSADADGDVLVHLLPASDLQNVFRCRLLDTWQTEWDVETGNKLHAVKPTIGVWRSSSRPSRREDVILTRLRIGHSRLTHGHLLQGLDPPLCHTCNVILSIRHILVECVDLAYLRQTFNLSGCLSSLLGDDSSILSHVFSFLRRAGLFHRL